MWLESECDCGCNTCDDPLTLSGLRALPALGSLGAWAKETPLYCPDQRVGWHIGNNTVPDARAGRGFKCQLVMSPNPLPLPPGGRMCQPTRQNLPYSRDTDIPQECGVWLFEGWGVTGQKLSDTACASGMAPYGCYRMDGAAQVNQPTQTTPAQTSPTYSQPAQSSPAYTEPSYTQPAHSAPSYSTSARSVSDVPAYVAPIQRAAYVGAARPSEEVSQSIDAGMTRNAVSVSNQYVPYSGGASISESAPVETVNAPPVESEGGGSFPWGILLTALFLAT